MTYQVTILVEVEPDTMREIKPGEYKGYVNQEMQRAMSLLGELAEARRQRDAARGVVEAAVGLVGGGFVILDERGMVRVAQLDYQRLETAVEKYRQMAQSNGEKE